MLRAQPTPASAERRCCTADAAVRDNEYEFEAEMGEAVVEAELALALGGGEVRCVPVYCSS
jgi:hypothetical protein